jgi:hypothetical protein
MKKALNRVYNKVSYENKVKKGKRKITLVYL